MVNDTACTNNETAKCGQPKPGVPVITKESGTHSGNHAVSAPEPLQKQHKKHPLLNAKQNSVRQPCSSSAISTDDAQKRLPSVTYQEALGTQYHLVRLCHCLGTLSHHGTAIKLRQLTPVVIHVGTESAA